MLLGARDKTLPIVLGDKFIPFYWLTHTLRYHDIANGDVSGIWPADGRQERLWELEFYYRRFSAVKQCKLLQGSRSKNLNFFEFSRVSAVAHPLTKNPEDSGPKIEKDGDWSIYP